MEDKLKIIDRLTSEHPSIGVEFGLSWYTGGMTDTGEWYIRKMLDLPIEKLEAILIKITDRYVPSAPLSWEELADSKVFIQAESGHFMNVRTQKAFARIANDIEHKLMWGDGN